MSAIHLQSDEAHSLFHSNKGKLTGQKPPLKPRDVRAIRILLQIHEKMRDLTPFNLSIDSNLSSCDLVVLRGYTSIWSKCSRWSCAGRRNA